jgi:hypothetical protein
MGIPDRLSDDPGTRRAFTLSQFGSRGVCTHTAIFNYVNLAHRSAAIPTKTLSLANDAEVFNGMLGALGSHEFLFG